MTLDRDTDWAERWQQSWDRLEEAHMGDRELRIRALIDVAEAMAGQTPTVLELACGTGTVTRRLLTRLPAARSIAVDLDPLLLTIASATFADDDRVQIVRADLRDAGWASAVPATQVDAVLTATALHWLPEPVVDRLYQDLARLVRPGGVVAHVEQMPLLDLPQLSGGLARAERERLAQRQREQPASWDTWWENASRDPRLRAAAAQRRAMFAGNYPTEEFSPPADWHIAALGRAGFGEVGVVWRSGNTALVAAVR